jgi:tripartite-type tricarboxylate transporter receptor subunit TctC
MNQLRLARTTNLQRRRLAALGVSMLVAGALPVAGIAATTPWPQRPLRLLVGFPAGSSPDLVARLIAEPLGKRLGQAVVVENRPGASGNIAADLLAKSTDGHTFGLMINGNMTVAKLLNPRTPYDPHKDLQPVGLLVQAPLILVGLPSAPSNFADWLVQARMQGDKLSYGSPGVGTVAHLAMELLKSSSQLSAVHVPYPGNPQVTQALLRGEIQAALLPPGIAMPQVRAGKLIALGVTSEGRSPLVSDLASLASQGVKGFDFQVWNALAAPASQPAAQSAQVWAHVQEILRSPETRQALFNQGWQVAGLNADALARRIQTDTQAMQAVIQRLGVRVE